MGIDKRFQALDGWRGLCALFVALFHLNVYGHFYASPFIRNSYLFVDFFFVLSGFVITNAYGEKLNNFHQMVCFIIRRFGRVWPLHAFVLSIFVVMEFSKLFLVKAGLPSNYTPFSNETSFNSLASNIFLVQSLGTQHAPTWNIPSWSISTEFYTYILVALIYVLLNAHQKILSITLCALALISTMLVVSHSKSGQDAPIEYCFFRCLTGFLCGAAVSSLHRRYGARLIPLGNAMEIGAVCLVVGFVSAVGHSAYSFAAPIVFSCVVFIFAAERGFISKSMSLLKRLGDWSYSIYMIHLCIAINLIDRPITIFENIKHIEMTKINNFVPGSESSSIIILGGPFQADMLSVFYLIALIFLASQSYRWIEVPWRNYFNRLASRLARSHAPSSAARDTDGLAGGSLS